VADQKKIDFLIKNIENDFKFKFLKMKNNSQTYQKPALEELGSAKDIIKNVLESGSNDTFPGTEEILSSV
tara:strand:- start:1074 stop:1283 length:210 start_codon:yes stop_codon:yes gene_type:complete